MKKIRKKLRLLALILGIAAILFAIFYKPADNSPVEQEISYTQFIQMIDDGTITNIDLQQGETHAKAQNAEDTSVIYLVEIPSVTVVSEYIQNKIAEGSSVELTIDELESSSGLSFLLLLPQLMLILYLVFMISSFVRMFKKGKNGGSGNSNIPNSPFTAGLFNNDTHFYEKTAKSTVTFKDVAGLDEEKKELMEVVDFIKHPEKYQKFGAKIPNGVLLDGHPGTGKTLLAKAVAGEAGIACIATSGSEFVEMYVGVGASRIRSLFKEAEKMAPCIIFFDEIDALGGNRDHNSGASEHNQTLNQLLTEMDGFAGKHAITVIAATNRPDSLDPALTRPGRFDRKITIHLPDLKGREEILRLHGKNKPFDETVDFRNLAYNTAGFSGAGLENLLNEAAIVAVRKQHIAINMDDITEAMMKIQVGLKKTGRIISEAERKLTAVHEAGHAIVSLFLESQANLKEVCIIPRGSAGGYTLHDTVEDKNYISKKELTERLICLLGGKAAEDIVLGDISTGPSNDLKVATQTARDMIIYYGMDGDIGPISFAGASRTDLDIFGEKTLSSVGDKIAEMVKKAEEEAKKLITEHRDLLNELVNRLLEKETVSGEEINEMFAAYKK